MTAQSIFIEKPLFYLFKEIYLRNPVAVRSFEGKSPLWSISAIRLICSMADRVQS